MNLLSILQRRVMGMIGRGVVKIVNDSLKMQGMQVSMLSDETRDKIERVQNYGFTSVPKEGAEAVVLFLGGNRDHGIAIAVDDRRYRLKGLESGEVAIYTDEGDSVALKRDHKITVEAAGDALKPGEITINAKGTGCKVTVLADAIELTSEQVGAVSEAILMGERFQLWADTHIHTSGFVAPTSPPVIQSQTFNNTPLSHLSTVAKVGTVPVAAP
jgi:phage baseplate assembly protein V